MVSLHKNKNQIVAFTSAKRLGQSGPKFRDPIIQTILELKRGDMIKVICYACQGSRFSSLSFSGSLLQEL